MSNLKHSSIYKQPIVPECKNECQHDEFNKKFKGNPSAIGDQFKRSRILGDSTLVVRTTKPSSYLIAIPPDNLSYWGNQTRGKNNIKWHATKNLVKILFTWRTLQSRACSCPYLNRTSKYLNIKYLWVTKYWYTAKIV